MPKSRRHTGPKLVLTVSEAAGLLNVSRAKVYLLLEEKLLHAFKLGEHWRIRSDSLAAMLAPEKNREKQSL